MKKKLVSVLLCGTMAASLLAGCGGASAGGAAAGAGDAAVDAAVDAAEEAASEVADAEGSEAAEEVEAVTDTTGPEDGTPLELWTFVELHGTFYRDMCDKWNEQNPDKQIKLTTVTYPYGDMHQKMIMSL